MTLKNILVHLDDSPQCRHRLDVAAELARGHDAHLSGIYVVPLPAVPAIMSAGYFPEGVIAEQEERERERSKKVKAEFDGYMKRAGIPSEWREREGALASIVSMNARYADLVIVSQVDPAGTAGYEMLELPADVALSAGRPVLVIPYDVGDVLLSRASDLGADMIVIGAYGRSRMREFILGGVTRHLLQHMTVPILMSH